MEIVEFNLKKERLIIKENNKKIKYSMTILNLDEFKLAYCKKYFWNFFPSQKSSMSNMLNSIHVSIQYQTYMTLNQMDVPFKKTKDENYFAVIIENNELINILDNQATIDYIESIKIGKKLMGVL